MNLSSVIDLCNAGRTSNRQRALAEFSGAEPLGRSELAKNLNLSVQAASNIADDLLKAGLIREVGIREGGRGLPVALYDLNPDGAFSLGFEIRPAAIYATVKDQTGADRAQVKLQLGTSDPDIIILKIVSQTNNFFKSLPLKGRVIGAGIVRPGPFGNTGLSNSKTELPDLDIPNLHKLIESAIGIPTLLDNDATAGACAEYQIGSARNVDDFAYLYFGSGLGLGVVSNGSPVRGAFGNSGEIGHLKLCSFKGILENHLSRSSLEQYLSDHGITASNITEITELYTARNEHLFDWISNAALALEEAVTIIENMLDPATIVLGGAMPPEVLEALIEKCSPATNTVSSRPDRTLPRLQVGTCGQFTVSGGAASLVLNRFFNMLP